jgi:hypothetical protein
MLRSVTHLQGATIHATDGEIGKVDQFYFDDETWAIRYLVANTSHWPAGRLVLISPIALVQRNWESKRLDVALTKKQIENSPPIDTHKPVLTAARGRIPGLLRLSLLLGRTQPVGSWSLPGRRGCPKGCGDGRESV